MIDPGHEGKFLSGAQVERVIRDVDGRKSRTHRGPCLPERVPGTLYFALCERVFRARGCEK